MKQGLQRIIAVLLLLIPMTRSALGAGIEGYTPFNLQGQCTVQTDAGYEPVVLNQFYPFGKTVKTDRNSFLDLRFSEGNTFRLLARTTITITEDVKDPKLKILQLTSGSVDLSLDQYPKDHKLQVETPSAICGAVGTRFVVEFEAVEGSEGSRTHSFRCDQGEVQIASRFTVDDEIVIGQSFAVSNFTAGSEMVAEFQEGVNNAYTDVTVNRGRLDFNYGGREGVSFTVEAEEPPPGQQPVEAPRFTCALEKRPDGTTVVAFKMIRGVAAFSFFGGQAGAERVTARDGAVLVPGKKVETETGEVVAIEKGVQAEAVAAQYLETAKTEGTENAKLVDLRITQAPQAEVVAQQAVVQEAAAKTSSVLTKVVEMIELISFKKAAEDVEAPQEKEIEEQPQEEQEEEKETPEEVEPEAKEEAPTQAPEAEVESEASATQAAAETAPAPAAETTPTPTKQKTGPIQPVVVVTTSQPTISELKQIQDSDGDGLSDADEEVVNSGQALDSDGDGVADVVENAAASGQAKDSDSDGIADVLEEALGLNPALATTQYNVQIASGKVTFSTSNSHLNAGQTEFISFTVQGEIFAINFESLQSVASRAAITQPLFRQVGDVYTTSQGLQVTLVGIVNANSGREYVFHVSNVSNHALTGGGFAFQPLDANDQPVSDDNITVDTTNGMYAADGVGVVTITDPNNISSSVLLSPLGTGAASPIDP